MKHTNSQCHAAKRSLKVLLIIKQVTNKIKNNFIFFDNTNDQTLQIKTQSELGIITEGNY